MEQEIQQTFDDQQEYIDLLEDRIEALEGFIWTFIDYLGACDSDFGTLQGRLESEYKKVLKS